MKISVISDLHIDVNDNYQYLLNKLKNVDNTDVLIIAGDLSAFSYKKRNKFIDKVLLSQWKNVLLVPGNHEFYYQQVEEDKRLIHCHERYMHNGNLLYTLNNSSSVLKNSNVKFIFSTLWSNIERNVFSILMGLNDYRQIKGFDVAKNNQLHGMSVDFIKNELENTKDDEDVIIVSHHLPLYELIDTTYVNNILNEAYATNLFDSIIDKYSNKIKYWISGHSHSECYKEVVGVKFIRKPIGYFPEEKSNSCIPLTIEV